MEHITIVLNLLQAVSIIIAAIAAIIGINSWRNELKWKKKYELAEEVLGLVYDIYDRFGLILFPLFYPDESKRNKVCNETEKQTFYLDTAFLTLQRINEHREAFNKLRSIKYRFMAIFGKKHGDLIEDIYRLFKEITYHSISLSKLITRELNGETLSSSELETIEELNTELTQGFIYDGHIKQQLDEIISKIESNCKVVITHWNH